MEKLTESEFQREKQLQSLMEASTLALGFLCASPDTKEQAKPIIAILAKALKSTGSNCTYLDPIILYSAGPHYIPESKK